jgi:hypothetical protein
MQPGKNVPSFRRNVLHPSPGSKGKSYKHAAKAF